MVKLFSRFYLLILFVFGVSVCYAQTDTLRVMSYNVLYYGETPSCTGNHAAYHNCLKTIVGYTQPDILGLVKMAAPANADNPGASAPIGFPDSVLRFALDAAMPNTFAYCPYTNSAHANNIEVLYYNKRKLGFCCVVSSYANITDFNTYKLYYKSTDLAVTNDTIFLYVTLNHTKSGDENVAVRGKQLQGEMSGIKRHFTTLPNMINMGDFNTRGADEPCYAELVNATDTGFRFYDPPFYEGRLTYPADWDNNKGMYAAFLTTSTREMAPNNCGTGGGAKNWYDHIFLSRWIMDNTDRVQYIRGSYKTIGNDGNRLRISINNNNVNVNTSAPADVIEALYHMSNKYPVMASLAITPSSHHITTASPEIRNVSVEQKEVLTFVKVDGDALVINFPKGTIGQQMRVMYTDDNGATAKEKNFTVTDATMQVPFHVKRGHYIATIYAGHSVALKVNVVKE